MRSYRRREDVLDDWALLRSEGYTIPQAADRLGMTCMALRKALERARVNGDPRARFTYAGTKRAEKEEVMTCAE